MPTSETTAALAAILSNVAKQYDPRADASFKAQVAVNGSPSPKPLLPGPDSADPGTWHRWIVGTGSAKAEMRLM